MKINQIKNKKFNQEDCTTFWNGRGGCRNGHVVLEPKDTTPKSLESRHWIDYPSPEESIKGNIISRLFEFLAAANGTQSSNGERDNSH